MESICLTALSLLKTPTIGGQISSPIRKFQAQLQSHDSFRILIRGFGLPKTSYPKHSLKQSQASSGASCTAGPASDDLLDLRFRGESTCPLAYRWSAGNEGMEKKMETTMMGYIETTIL